MEDRAVVDAAMAGETDLAGAAAGAALFHIFRELFPQVGEGGCIEGWGGEPLVSGKTAAPLLFGLKNLFGTVVGKGFELGSQSPFAGTAGDMKGNLLQLGMALQFWQQIVEGEGDRLQKLHWLLELLHHACGAGAAVAENRQRALLARLPECLLQMLTAFCCSLYFSLTLKGEATAVGGMFCRQHHGIARLVEQALDGGVEILRFIVAGAAEDVVAAGAEVDHLGACI